MTCPWMALSLQPHFTPRRRPLAHRWLPLSRGAPPKWLMRPPCQTPATRALAQSRLEGLTRISIEPRAPFQYKGERLPKKIFFRSQARYAAGNADAPSTKKQPSGSDQNHCRGGAAPWSNTIYFIGAPVEPRPRSDHSFSPPRRPSFAEAQRT